MGRPSRNVSAAAVSALYVKSHDAIMGSHHLWMKRELVAAVNDLKISNRATRRKTKSVP